MTHNRVRMSIKRWRRFFPLTRVEDVVALVTNIVAKDESCHSADTSTVGNTKLQAEANLAFLSIVLGYLENHLVQVQAPLMLPSPHVGGIKGSRKRRSSCDSGSSGKRRATATKEAKNVPVVAVGPTDEDYTVTLKSEVLNEENKDETEEKSVPTLPTLAIPDKAMLLDDDSAKKSTMYKDLDDDSALSFVFTFGEAERLYQDFIDMVNQVEVDLNSKNTPAAPPPTTCVSSSAGDTPTDDRVVPAPPGPYSPPSAREVVMAVCHKLWARVSSMQVRAEKMHVQSVYSFLTDSQLDSFGLAYSVTAACQLLGYQDRVHLTLSEDHAWVEVDGVAMETCCIRATGGISGSPSLAGMRSRERGSWLYLNNRPVVCGSRSMTCAAAVTAVNTKLNASAQSSKILHLKHRLLLSLHSLGALSHYPLALANLGELDDASCSRDNLPSTTDATRPLVPGSSTPAPNYALRYYREAVWVAQHRYDDQHVYPYIFAAGYFYRHSCFSEAVQYWAEAARVISQYVYVKDDCEIYKEFQEIATQLMPNMMKTVTEPATSLELPPSSPSTPQPDTTITCPLASSSLPPLHRYPAAYAAILRFLDGLCLWEEGSAIPVLHIGWTGRIMFTLSKFDLSARSKVSIVKEETNEVNNHSLLHPIVIHKPLSSAKDNAVEANPKVEFSNEPTPSLAECATNEDKLNGDINKTDEDKTASSCKKMDDTDGSEPSAVIGCTTQPSCYDEPLSMNSTRHSKTKHGDTVIAGASGDLMSIDITDPPQVLWASPEEADMLDWSSSSCASAGSPKEIALLDNTDLLELARSCSKRILNLDFLLNVSSEPFLPPESQPESSWISPPVTSSAVHSSTDNQHFFTSPTPTASTSSRRDKPSTGALSTQSLVEANTIDISPIANHISPDSTNPLAAPTSCPLPAVVDVFDPTRDPVLVPSYQDTDKEVQIALHSSKMEALGRLVTAKSLRLNTSAIQLQLTALTQQVSNKRFSFSSNDKDVNLVTDSSHSSSMRTRPSRRK